MYGRELSFPLCQHLVPYLFFVAGVSGGVKYPADQFVGQVLLRNPVVAVGMGIQVSFSVPERFSVAVCIFQVIRHLGLFPFYRLESVKETERAV